MMRHAGKMLARGLLIGLTLTVAMPIASRARQTGEAILAAQLDALPDIFTQHNHVPGASTEPPLHIHAQRPAADGALPFSGDPPGLRIGGRVLAGGDRLRGRAG
ncbi:hypothetical protein [Frigidibacter sp. ROC022]|uniref:hypothetical protein n=1 Tax=Frigidibacter sp. ROC022 TaxID=2971796 RepID=UPI00215B6537|nr:hypothetical protein [Frigidibacter sp. ROC022]MCR8725085.1 hypothetical protein [Frigidibacter sp. ROC022]